MTGTMQSAMCAVRLQVPQREVNPRSARGRVKTQVVRWL